MTTNPLQPTKQIYSVSELNRTIRNLLETEFPLMWIEGEISNLAIPASGHMYFSLKDSRAQVRCAMFKSKARFLRFKPENGQQILIRAKVGLYEQRGEFQLIAEHMEEAGDGALQRQYDQLKSRLNEEGLFDESIKQAIPSLPRQIGIITSATGAAVRDALSILKRRFPAIPVVIFAVAVQGDTAAAQMIHAIDLANQHNSCDVLLLIRGGGSLEDLWAFNNEQLARCIVASNIPIISGVGHEVDVTIADFSADLRAATPSAAAEQVSPDQQSYIESYHWYQQRLQQLLQQQLQQASEKLQWLKNRLQLQHPKQQLEQQSQQLDEHLQNLQSAWHYYLQQHQHRLAIAKQGLLSYQPGQQLQQRQQQLLYLSRRLRQATQNMLTQKNQRLAASSHALHIISPLQTLGRGYALATDQYGKLLRDSQQVHENEPISIRLHKGFLLARVEKVTNS